MDVSGAFGPFLRHNGTSPICTNGGVVQFDVLHPDRILLPNGLDAGTYFITFYLEPNHGYSIVHAQQDANYGANSTFQNEFGLIDHNGALKSSAIPSQEQVSFSGPNLKIGAGATELVTPHGEPTMTRTVEITGTNVTVPSGKIIFKDKHSFAASGLDDPISIVRIHYGALDIYPIPNDGVEGEEWFVIDQVTHAALYNDVLAGSAVVQEVIEISALCTRNRPTDGITSELTIGWNCNGDPTLPFDDSYSATGRKIKPDILKPDIVPEYVSKALPDCYYTPNGYTTLELRIINQGDLVGRLRTFGLNWENYWFTPGSNMGRIEISTDAPMEISRPYYYLTDPPDWSDQITITNPDAAQYNGAIVRTGSSCGSADLESLMFFTGQDPSATSDFLIPSNGVLGPGQLGPGQAISIKLRIRNCGFPALEGMACPTPPNPVMAGYDLNALYDWDCDRLSQNEIHGLADEPLPGHSFFTYSRVEQIIGTSTRTQYIGTTYNLQGACAYDDVDHQATSWDVRFKWRDEVTLWPRPDLVSPSHEKLGVVIELEPYLFLNASDLNGTHPLKISVPHGPNQEHTPVVFSTAPVGNELALTVVTGNGTTFCSDLDCPALGGTGGWAEDQKVMLLFSGFDPNSPLWVDGQRKIAWLKDAVMKIPLRMHCPSEAASACENEAHELLYVPGCEYTASAYPPAGPKKLKISLVHIPNDQCTIDGFCAASSIPLSCHVQSLFIQCPGCARVGIHSNDFSIERWSYGQRDDNDDGFADDGPDTNQDGLPDPIDITYAELSNPDPPQVDRRKAMFGDILTSTLNTTIEMECGGYGPCDGNGPEVQLHHLFYEMAFVLASAPCQNGLVEFVDMDIRFHPANGEDFTVHIGEGANSDASPIIVSGPGGLVFDLSPGTTIAGKSYVQITDNYSSPARYASDAFLFNDYDGTAIDITVRTRVICNIGLVSEQVEVDTWIYLTQGALNGSLSPQALNSQFAPFEDANLTYDVDGPGGDPPVAVGINGPNEQYFCAAIAAGAVEGVSSCENIRFYCTRKGGGFTLVGYTYMVRDFGTRWYACDYGVGRTLILDIERSSEGGAPTNAFPNEFRNWMSLRGGLNWIDGTTAGDWSSGRIAVVEQTHGGIRIDDQSLEHPDGGRAWTITNLDANTYFPESILEGNTVHHLIDAREDATPVFRVTNGTKPSNDAINHPTTSVHPNTLLLPDDGFGLSIAFLYSANCTTPDGPAPILNAIHNPLPYYHFVEIDVAQNPLVDLPCTGPWCQESGSRLQVDLGYARPVLSLKNYEDIQAPNTCWTDIVLNHNSPSEYDHSPFNGIWASVDESPDNAYPIGLNVQQMWVDYGDGWGYRPINDGNDIVSNVKYALPIPQPFGYTVFANSNVKFKVCAAMPCAVRFSDDVNNGLVPGDEANQPDAEVLLRVGWNCGAPPVLEDMTSGCPVEQTLRYEPPIPQLSIDAVHVVPVACDRYTVTMDVRSSGNGPVKGLEFGWDAASGQPWEYVTGSARVTASDGTFAIEGNGLPSTADQAGGCIHPATPERQWSLGMASCTGCSPALNSILTEGLPPGPQGGGPNTVKVSFDVHPGNCSTLNTVLGFWARSTSCGVLCQIASVNVRQSVYPSSAIAVSLNAPSDLNCEQTSTATITVINNSTLSQAGINVGMDLPSALSASLFTTGCGSASVSSGHLTWGPFALPAGQSCQLSFTLTAQSDASSTLLAEATSTCCALSFGSATATVNTHCSCNISANITPTPSLCGGPWNDACGAFQVNSSSPPVRLDGTDYKFRFGGAAFLAYASGTFVMTGELINVDDVNFPEDRFWMQLYLTDAQGYDPWVTSAPVNHLVDAPQNVDPTTWSFLDVNTDGPSVFVGLGANAGVQYSIDEQTVGQAEYRFQRGVGASTVYSGEGASLLFATEPAGDSGTQDWIHVGMNCHQTWGHYSPCTGSITANSVTDANGPYTITLDPPGSDPPIVHEGWNGSAPYSFTDLCNNFGQDQYQLTITNGAGCTYSEFITLGDGSPPLSANLVYSPMACSEDHGCATFTASGGAQPNSYQAHWFWQGVVSGTEAVTDPGEQYCDLPTGEEVWVEVRDAHGCYISYKFYFVVDPDGHGPGFDADPIPASCGQNDGEIHIAEGSIVNNDHHVNNASAVYTWYDENDQVLGHTDELEHLAPGDYTVVVAIPNQGCPTTMHVSVGSTATIAASVISQVNPKCHGDHSGIATVAASTGTAPFTYLWNTTPPITEATAGGLSGGEYSCVVTDANGCQVTVPVTMTDPSALVLELTAHTDVNCLAANSGSATMSGSGGVGPYTYTWNTSPQQYTASVSGLVAGHYTCSVMDHNSCTTQLVVDIASASAYSATTSQTNVLCMGAHTGSTTVTVSGGLAPYTYSWSPSGGTGATATNLGAGTYICTVTDANGCKLFPTVTITEPSEALVATLSSQTNVLCRGNSTGSATVTVPHGAAPFTFVWNTSPEQHTATASDLIAGSYMCTVTDANGCTTTVSVTITQPASALSVTPSQTNVTCHGQCNGAASVTAQGGTSPYTYAWSTGQTTSSRTGLCAGSLSVIVTDNNGCTQTIQFTITEPATLQANLSSTNGDCSGYCSGSSSATVSGGTSGYTYGWSPAPGSGQGTLNASAMCPGSYTFTATDANGCQATASATITNACSGPSISNCTNLTDLSRSGGSVSVVPVSGANHYQFNFSTPCGYNRNIATTSTTQALNFSTVPLEDCQTYTVKARVSMVAADEYGEWGPPCTLTTSGCATPMQLKPAHVWPSNLVTYNTGFVEVNKRNDAYRYQFEFWSVDGSDNPVAVVKTITPVAQGQTGAVYQCNKANVNGSPLLSQCTKYKVRVRRSLDCTTNWESTWGPYVLIKTTGTCGSGMAVQGGGGVTGVREGSPELLIFPNPNDGSLLYVSLSGLTTFPAGVEITLIDVMGRLVKTRKVIVENDPLMETMEFDHVLAPGVYSVRVNTVEGEFTRNLVIER